MRSQRRFIQHVCDFTLAKPTVTFSFKHLRDKLLSPNNSRIILLEWTEKKKLEWERAVTLLPSDLSPYVLTFRIVARAKNILQYYSCLSGP